MKSSMNMSLIALIVSAVALAATAVNLSFLGSSERDAPLPTTEPNAELLARIDALDDGLRALRDQLTVLDDRPAPDQVRIDVGEFASKSEFDALQEELRTVLGITPSRDRRESAESPVSEISLEFKQQVSEALTEVRKKEQVEEVQKWQESRAARLKEMMPEVTQKLGLAPYQQELMQSALEGIYQAQADVKAGSADDMPDGRTPREVWDDNLQAFLGELGGFLTPHQLELYRTLEADLFPGGAGK